MPAGNQTETIAIAGAGICGAYLYRLLTNRGLPCDIYDLPRQTHCGLTSCAWGTSREFIELARFAGLDAAKYVLRQLDHVVVDEVRIKADLMTIDKPAFIRDLLGGVAVRQTPLNPAEYQRVIDATGVSRAFLPEIKDDLLLECTQCRVSDQDFLENRIKLGRVGYAWCFPLRGEEYHIGCGSLVADARQLIKQLGWLEVGASRDGRKIICGCRGVIRVTGPHRAGPYVTRKGAQEEIWGVGEAIGCVAPLAGDGIVPGMKSVKLLMGHWHDAAGYTAAILREFNWMLDERRVVDKLRLSLPLGMRDAWVLKRNSKRMGMHIPLRKAALLLQHLR